MPTPGQGHSLGARRGVPRHATLRCGRAANGVPRVWGRSPFATLRCGHAAAAPGLTPETCKADAVKLVRQMLLSWRVLSVRSRSGGTGLPPPSSSHANPPPVGPCATLLCGSAITAERVRSCRRFRAGPRARVAPASVVYTVPPIPRPASRVPIGPAPRLPEASPCPLACTQLLTRQLVPPPPTHGSSSRPCTASASSHPHVVRRAIDKDCLQHCDR